MAFIFGGSATNDYYVRAQLPVAGPINCVCFDKNGKYLASGGDDEVLHVWDVGRNKTHQLISDHLGRWGQITTIAWITGLATGKETLCFGTGRGMILLYRQKKEEDKFYELSNTEILPFNEPVESMDYSQRNQLVISGHSGKVKLIQIEKNGTLITLWSKNINDLTRGMPVIPRSVRFTTKAENILVFGLESGVMLCLTTATGAESWNKVLKSGIGNIAMSADEKWLLVDNLAQGFDLYQFPHSSPSDIFTIPRQTCHIFEAAFLENETAIACGSDHGVIHIFSLETIQCLQKLKHGGKKAMIQAIDACFTGKEYLIASGSSERKATIYIWEKKIKGYQVDRQSHGCGWIVVLITLALINVLSIALVNENLRLGLADPWLKLKYAIGASG